MAQKKGNSRVRQRRGIALLILGVCAVFVLITKLLAPRPGPQIILQWDFSAPGMVAPASFQVERADGESSLWRVVGHVAPTARTWTDQAVQPGTTYCYRVSALSGTAGVLSSLPSSVACEQAPAPSSKSQVPR